MSYARIRITWPKGALTAALDEVGREEAQSRDAVSAGEGEQSEREARLRALQGELLKAREQVVPPGTVCFWVDGSSLALPWGRTPISSGSESKLVSPCNILGCMDGDPRRLVSVRSGDMITVSVE